MGLPGPSATINKISSKSILDTFSLQIINEYDLQQGKKYPPETIKPHPYMATRISKRSTAINKARRPATAGASGTVISKVKSIFDISSRGTGATILSPGAQNAKASWLPVIGEGYSSGLADLDEMLGSAVI